MRKNLYSLTVLAVLAASALVAGCGKQQEKLQAAVAAENTGNHRQASQLFAALALESAPALRLLEAQNGRLLKPELWAGEIDKYMKWVTEPVSPPNATLHDALKGLDRTTENLESDNTATHSPAKPYDTPNSFHQHWNLAFNPPITTGTGTIDWNGIVKRASDGKFSILLLTARSHVYDINVISRKTSRRVNFTLYPETKVYIPLPPAEYTLIVKSSGEFPGGQRWTSELTALKFKVEGEPAAYGMELKTKVARK